MESRWASRLWADVHWSNSEPGVPETSDLESASESKAERGPRSAALRSLFFGKLNFIGNKNARPNSLGSLGYFDTVNFLQMNFRAARR